MVQLSPSAVSEVLRLKAKRSTSQVLFRIGVQPGGCLDMIYTMKFDEVVHPGEQLFNCNGVQVVIDQQSLSYVDGLVLDYSEDLMGGGFRFQNPKVFQSCGCGNSFSIAV